MAGILRMGNKGRERLGRGKTRHDITHLETLFLHPILRERNSIARPSRHLQPPQLDLLQFLNPPPLVYVYTTLAIYSVSYLLISDERLTEVDKRMNPARTPQGSYVAPL